MIILLTDLFVKHKRSRMEFRKSFYPEIYKSRDQITDELIENQLREAYRDMFLTEMIDDLVDYKLYSSRSNVKRAVYTGALDVQIRLNFILKPELLEFGYDDEAAVCNPGSDFEFKLYFSSEFKDDVSLIYTWYVNSTSLEVSTLRGPSIGFGDYYRVFAFERDRDKYIDVKYHLGDIVKLYYFNRICTGIICATNYERDTYEVIIDYDSDDATLLAYDLDTRHVEDIIELIDHDYDKMLEVLDKNEGFSFCDEYMEKLHNKTAE